MKSFSLISIACAALIFSFQTGRDAVAQDSPSTIQKWEFKVLRSTRGSVSEKELNELGDQGWELVAVRSIGTAEAANYFKRKKG